MSSEYFSIEHLVGAIASLLRSVDKNKGKNVYLEKFVGILEDKLDNSTCDVVHESKVNKQYIENNELIKQVDTLKKTE